MSKQTIKFALQKLGLFPYALIWKRRFSKHDQSVKAEEKILYGRYVKPGDLVFDIGVNVGQKSEIFLAIGARVVGVEPNPHCHPVIDLQFARNPNYTLLRKALGAEEGKATLRFVGTEATASLREDWRYLDFYDRPIEEAETAVTTLDALVEEYGVPVLCKIDVEGFEASVIAGLSRPLPLISFEYHLNERPALEACLDRLESLGPIEVNANRMDTGDLVFAQWLSKEAFLASPELPAEADCWVRPRAS
jgi:FkbM family methyltransferase